MDNLWVTFPITAHKFQQTKRKIVPDLANAPRVKTTPSEILPTFILYLNIYSLGTVLMEAFYT